jgi:hypothetical protein
MPLEEDISVEWDELLEEPGEKDECEFDAQVLESLGMHVTREP